MQYKNIDVKLALEQLGGSEKLYKTVVSGFNDRYRQVDEDINQYLQNSEMEDARRLAHSIKGLCGNLGAMQLRKKALELEVAIKSDAVNVQAYLQDFSKELGKVVEDIQCILEDSYGLSQRDQSLGKNEGRQFGNACRRLMTALASDKRLEIKHALDAVMSVSIPDQHAPKIHEVVQLINQYEYDMAVNVLREVYD